MPSHQTPAQVVSAVLEPGERILWAGRPDAESMIARERHRVRLRRYVGTAILLAVVVWLVDRVTPAGTPDSLDTSLLTEPRVLVPAAIVIPAFSAFGVRRFERYARSLVYGLTDRRLLVMEDSEVVDERTPETASRPVLRGRGRGRADVVFGRRERTSADRRPTRDPVQREREIVAFKALEDAESVQTRVDAWLAEHVRAAEADVGAAVSARTPSPGLTAAVGHLPSGADAGGTRHVTLGTPGLQAALPIAWQVRVRRKKKPYGRIFLDREDWRDPDEPGDWNVVRADGPLGCSIEIEVFDTPPTVTFESLSNSRLGDAAAGLVTATDRDVRINGLTGFSVTRRNDVQVDHLGTAREAAVVVLTRTTALYDAGRQICARSTWPEESDDLARAVNESVRSIRPA